MRDSAYKRTLRALADGSAVKVDGPSGSLTLHRTRRAAVFIARGSASRRSRACCGSPRATACPTAAVAATGRVLESRAQDSAFLDRLRAIARRRQLLARHHDDRGGRLAGGRGDDRAGDRRGGLPAPIFYVAGGRPGWWKRCASRSTRRASRTRTSAARSSSATRRRPQR